jgi:gas vesicle protein
MGEDPEAIRADIERTRAEMGDTVEALGYKADVKSRAKEKISGMTPDGRQAKRAANAAQENPLGLLVGSVAVGFLAGLLVPSSRMEDEKIGPMADQVKDQIKETGQEALDRGKEVAQQAAETAKDAGREQAQELRGSAQERAQTVGTS